MQDNFKLLNREVLLEISPTLEERERILALAKKLEQNVAITAHKKGIDAIVRVEGSVAKDTWLKKEPDIDIFMCLPQNTSRKTLRTISLEIAREATKGWQQVERFAEHPYLEAFVEGYRVNVVPCYRADRGKWLSATDRTPFHTDYVNKHLNQALRGEVRLLKKFLQGIEIYGAEIRVGGFSGYLCELLVIHFRSFLQVLKAFARYAPTLVIDIEKYYTNREKELKLLFDEPLVVIDPVDKARNVASAVKPDKIYTLVGAARGYLKTPSTVFFFPPKRSAFSSKELLQNFGTRRSDCLLLVFNSIRSVPDVVWGQLYKTQRALRRMLELSDFTVLRDSVWSDEEKICSLIFELEHHVLPGIKRHMGPPLEREKECENFLQKYVNSSFSLSGPYIEEGRWVVEIQRNQRDAVALLREKLNEGGREVGVAKLISQALKDGFKVMVNSEILETYLSNSDFAEFVTAFLRGKPFWLESDITQPNKQCPDGKAVEGEEIESSTCQRPPEKP